MSHGAKVISTKTGTVTSQGLDLADSNVKLERRYYAARALRLVIVHE